jgi:hypothetical protein
VLLNSRKYNFQEIRAQDSLLFLATADVIDGKFNVNQLPTNCPTSKDLPFIEITQL